MPLVFFLCLLLLGTPALAQETPWPKVSVRASFAVSTHQVSGEVLLQLPAQYSSRLELGKLKLEKATWQGRPWHPQISEGGLELHTQKATQIRLWFSGELNTPGNMISQEGISLTGVWFPALEGLALYDLKVKVPLAFEAVAPADQIVVKHRGPQGVFHFIFPHPCPPPPLAAARFFLWEKTRHGLTVAVYLLENDPKLAETYLQKARGFIKHYSKLLGPYPYKRFAVVENLFETGFAYPSLTLLGRTVIHLPFIPDTSLRHEILHNWFGNGVFVDWRQGNWCEGLVTYLADQQRAEEKGQGADYRHQLLVNYESFVHPSNDYPLRLFRERGHNRAWQAIGYGKGAFLFHMLRQQVGDKAFFQALRNFYQKELFKTASWADLEEAFAQTTRQDLSWFFNQWLNRPGLPRLHLYQGRILPIKKGRYIVGLEVEQDEPCYRLKVPLVIRSTKETQRLSIELSGPRTRIDVTIKGQPLEARLDPGYDVARHLTLPEFPPVWARVLGTREILFVAPSSSFKKRYAPLTMLFKGKGLTFTTQSIGPESPYPVIVYLEKFPPSLRPLFHTQHQGDFVLEVQENPKAPEHILVWLYAHDKEALRAVLPKLAHLGRYQRIEAEKGRLLKEETPHYVHGVYVRLNGETWGVDLKRLQTIEEVAQAVSLSRVIFLGEEHDRYSHHLAELAVIKWLYEHGHQDLAIGLEMFQRPFQKALDDYIAGRIDEITFLKRSQYFKRWGFNWRLYKPILDYAREHHIPVVALNAPKELTDKVAQKGLKALSPQEKAQLPEIDFQNKAYRAFLKRVYEAHPDRLPKIKDFKTFYQAQLVWDETMAQSVASYLKDHPDRQMVVLAGEEHVIYGYGIPSRVARRGVGPYSIVLLGGAESLEPGAGDFVLFPPPKRPPFFALLGVLIKEEDKGLVIQSVLPGRPAQKAGLKKGDVILEADGQKLHDIADLKLVLYQKRPKDKVKLLILRKGKTKKITVGPFEVKAEKPHNRR